MRHAIPLLVVVLAACQAGTPNGNNSGAHGDLPVSDLVLGGCGAEEGKSVSTDDTGVGDTASDPESLDVIALSAGEIQIENLHWGDECGGKYDVVTTVDGSDITVDYQRTTEETDCWCTYDFTFVVAEVPAGKWTVHAGTLTATVTVE